MFILLFLGYWESIWAKILVHWHVTCFATARSWLDLMNYDWGYLKSSKGDRWSNCELTFKTSIWCAVNLSCWNEKKVILMKIRNIFWHLSSDDISHYTAKCIVKPPPISAAIRCLKVSDWGWWYTWSGKLSVWGTVTDKVMSGSIFLVSLVSFSIWNWLHQ
jgi:hypothetical protein